MKFFLDKIISNFFIFELIKSFYLILFYKLVKNKFLMKKLLYTILLCGIVTNSVAQLPVDLFANDPLLKNANVGLVVKDLKTNKILYSYQPNKCFVPASVLKLVTTATALELLGPDFRFQTQLEIDGNLSADGVLNGNLFIRGGGDPTLGSSALNNGNFLDQWLRIVQQKGIKKINGQVIADASLYDNEGVSPFWLWEDIGNYYAAAVYGISYLDNTFQLVLQSGPVGTTPKIVRVIPPLPDLIIENYLKSTLISFDSAYFYGMPYSNVRRLYGEIPANRSSFVVKGDIPNPVLLLAQHFTEQLNKNGIHVTQDATDQVPSSRNRTVIYTHYSPPLKEIIAEINKNSNNHYAEQLFRYLALQNEKVATNSGAIKVITNFWKSKGLNVNQLFLYDGSGLSPMNAVSAQFITDLLTYMFHQSKYKTDFIHSLAVSGNQGTLKSFLTYTPLEGKVYAKSGNIARVKSYAGYMEKEDRIYAFTILVNNIRNSKAVQHRIEKFLLSIQ